MVEDYMQQIAKRNSYRFGTTWGWVRDERFHNCFGELSL